MKQYYSIAGLTVSMDTFGRTAEQAEAYRIGDCTREDIAIPDVWAVAKECYPNWSDDLGEYMMTGACFYRELLNFDGLMLHASCVVVDDRAYLFTANCGTGKSTHTNLWLQHFGDRAYILNDDKPALRLEEGVWYAYGTPWSGKHDISVNKRVPIAGIAIVERSETNTIHPISGFEALPDIIRQVNKPKAKEKREKLLELLDKLLTQVPLWKLRCNMEQEAALVAYEAMSTYGKEK